MIALGIVVLAAHALFSRRFRKHPPPTLIVWGKNDEIFPAAGAYPYMRNLKTVELHLLSTGHFALEEDGDLIAEYIRGFMGKHVRGDAMKAAGKGRNAVSTAP